MNTEQKFGNKKRKYEVLSKLRMLQFVLLTIIVALTIAPAREETNLIIIVAVCLLFLTLVINFKIKKEN